MHNQIHSFRLDRLNGAMILNNKFNPRWEVEISKEYIENLKKSL